VEVLEPTARVLTATDLAARLGAIPLSRIRFEPPPGSATEQDVIRIHEREGRLYELVDGILVEKTVGAYESKITMLIGHLLLTFVRPRKLGVVLGPDGMVRLAPGLVRIPDVSFISASRLPGGTLPTEPIPHVAPDLAVEVISRWNTPEEMEAKLHDYFQAGVKLVWYVYPAQREVHVFKPDGSKPVIGSDGTLEGGEVLPGFAVPVAELFAE